MTSVVQAIEKEELDANPHTNDADMPSHENPQSQQTVPQQASSIASRYNAESSDQSVADRDVEKEAVTPSQSSSDNGISGQPANDPNIVE